MSARFSRLLVSRRPILLVLANMFLIAEFSDESVLKSEGYQALTAWYDEALEPMVSYKNRRPFRFYKDYEPTAALKQ